MEAVCEKSVFFTTLYVIITTLYVIIVSNHDQE